MHSLLSDIAIAIIVATATTLILHFLKQPMILGYLVAGIIIGPHTYVSPQLVSDIYGIELISEIGLILLLFIIGLELNPRHVMANGKSILIAGIGQFPLNVVLGLAFFQLFASFYGYGRLELLYVAFFASLSSTAIVVKSLYDKYELGSIPGKITVGILIFQDLWAILLLVLQPNLNNPEFSLILLSIGKALVLLLSGFLISKYILSYLFTRISSSPELVVSVSIGWCAIVALTADLLDLSVEMGALIAGVSISTFPYHIHITARISPLRDFFMTLFFISLGMKIPAPEVKFILPLTLLILFVFFSRFIIIYPLLRIAGNSGRSGFLTSLNLTQISEFSPVIATLGLKYGHINELTLSLLLYALGITAITSTYFIKYSSSLYKIFLALYYRIRLPSMDLPEFYESHHSRHAHYPIIILGFHRGAKVLLDQVKIMSPHLLQRILVIDYNVEVLKELSQSGIKGIFGDVSNTETLIHAHVDRAVLIISTVPDVLLKGTSNLRLTETCRQLAPDAVIYATADMPEQIPALEKAGANHIVLPYSLAGKSLAREIAITCKGEIETILNEDK